MECVKKPQAKSWQPGLPCAGGGREWLGDSCSPDPGPCRGPRARPSHSVPAWSVGRKILQGNLGRHAWLRAAGKGGDKAIFFPAPNGKEMTFLLHKLDFLQLEKSILMPCCMMPGLSRDGLAWLPAIVQRLPRWPALGPGPPCPGWRKLAPL